MQKNENLYSTSDLSLASTINLFTPLWAVDRSDNNGKCLFLFKRESGLDSLIQGFWDGSLQVPPQVYFASLKAIKTRLYNG